MDLYKLCQKKSIKKIEACIEETGLKPDNICLINACRNKNNSKVINFLLDQGCLLDIDSFNTLIETEMDNRSIVKIVCDHVTKINNDLLTSKNRVDELEKRLNILKNGKNSKSINESLSEETSDVSSECSVDGSSYVESNGNPLKQSKTSYELIDTDDEFGDDLNNYISSINKFKIIDIDEANIVNIPKLKRVKRSVPPKYKEYFHKDEKDKMSFLDMKEELLKVIKDEKWYEKNNRTLINFPVDFKKAIGIKEEGLVRFCDIDKIIYLFF